MGADTIKRWYQIHARHFAHIRSLRSKEKQKFNAVKYEYITSDHNMNNIAHEIAKETKRNFKTKEGATLKTRNNKKRI